MTELGKCPFSGDGAVATPVAGRGPSVRDWWLQQVNLGILHQHNPSSNPLGSDFNYRRAFQQLDYQGLSRICMP